MLPNFIGSLLEQLKNYSITQFVWIGIALVALCAMFFPSRLPSFVALPCRMYIATLFVYGLYWLDDELDKAAKPWLIAAGLIAAGFTL